MRLAIILASLVFVAACTERQVFQMRWIEDLTFFIEMRTEPQEPKKVAVEKLEEEYGPLFTSSANGVQVLNLLDYEIITDITIHQNPEILLQYEKIILLHNEYVTSTQFDAIISHPNVIYLYPNALYAEIDFDEDLWEISLIRGHNYPDPLIRNGFDWKFDNSLEEYDVTCEDMKFSKIDNGWMLNCYPENILHKSKELLKQLREF